MSDSLTGFYEFVADEIVRNRKLQAILLLDTVLLGFLGLVLAGWAGVLVGIIIGVLLFGLGEIGNKIVRRRL